MDKQLTFSFLKKLLGEKRVLDHSKKTILYSQDLSLYENNNESAAAFVVFPKKNNEIVEIIRFANEHKIGLVPSGGRTGFCGGSVAKNKEIVVSFEAMNQIIDVNIQNKSMQCEAGVTLKTIQETAKKHGLFYPIDIASAETCQIGGNISTNAGGLHVIRYGLTRNWVSGIQVITPRGEILNLNNGLLKNATGYDLRHLFIGSEGTLGFITQATLQLTKPPKKNITILAGLSDIKAAINLLSDLQKEVSLHAFEFFCEKSLKSVIETEKLPYPFPEKYKYFALVEYEKNNQSLEKKILSLLKESKFVGNFLYSENKISSNAIWEYRKKISGSIRRFSPRKYDISVLTSNINDLIHSIQKDLKKIGCESTWFGHIGDGNLHLNVFHFDIKSEELDDLIYSNVEKYHGSISAEHGIGLIKKEFLKYTKTEAEIDYMRKIKKIFDPNSIMNPEKIW